MRFLRVALPIVFVAFVALIVASYTRAQFPAREADIDPVNELRDGDNPSLVMDAFEDTHSIAGRLVSRMRATRTIGFESGWYVLEDVDLALFSDANVEYSVKARQAQFNPETKQAEAVGGVEVSSSEGLAVSTARVTFDGEHVTNKLPVDFTVGGWVGHAGSIRLRLADETIYLLNHVTATLPADPSQERADLEAESAISYQRTGDIVFEGDVRVSRSSEVLVADKLRVGTSTGSRKLTGIAGEGNVLIRLLSGSSLVNKSSDELLGQGETRISAERFTGEVGDGSAIRALTIFGETIPARAIMHSAPRREMTAASIRVELTPEGVIESLHAAGGTSLQELGTNPRVVDSNDLKVSFDPLTREASGAVLTGSVRFRDRDYDGKAEKAIYDINDDRIKLMTVGDKAPTIATDGSLLKALTIDVSPRGGSLLGTGQVVVRYERSTGGPQQGSVLFGRTEEPVFVNAESVAAIRSSRVVTFSGGVKAWQSQSSLFSDEMQILRDGDEINGTGNVRIVVRQPAKDGTTQAMNARSDRLSATRDSGKVTLTGSVEIEEASRRLSADDAAFTFDQGNQIDTIQASGNVVLTDATGTRSARGDAAIYRVRQRTIRVSGSPAVLVDPSGEIKGSEILFDIDTEKVEVIGGEATYNPDSK